MTRPELHLPDLPEVSVQLGLPALSASAAAVAGQPARAPQAWSYRLLQGLSSYLPLLLMALLAVGTWWLVRNTPEAQAHAQRPHPARRPTTP